MNVSLLSVAAASTILLTPWSPEQAQAQGPLKVQANSVAELSQLGALAARVGYRMRCSEISGNTMIVELVSGTTYASAPVCP